MLFTEEIKRAAFHATVVLLVGSAMSGFVAAFAASVPVPVTAVTDQRSTAAAMQPAERLKGTLPSGTEIELVALSRYPDKGQPWWRPDGTVLDHSPFDASELDITSNGDPKFKKLELVFRLGKKADQPSYEAQIWSADDWSMWWAGRRTRGTVLIPDLKVVGIYAPADSKIINLDLKVAAGPWQELSSDGLQPRGALGAARATEGNDPSTLITASWADGQDVQMVAVEKNGTTHISRGSRSRKSGHIVETDFLFPHLAPARFKSFTLQTRPYELIHLQDIATAPGMRTDARLTSTPATQPAAK